MRLTAGEKSSNAEQLYKHLFLFCLSVFTWISPPQVCLLMLATVILQRSLGLLWVCVRVRASDATLLRAVKSLSNCPAVSLFSASILGPKSESNESSDDQHSTFSLLFYINIQPSRVSFSLNDKAFFLTFQVIAGPSYFNKNYPTLCWRTSADWHPSRMQVFSLVMCATSVEERKTLHLKLNIFAHNDDDGDSPETLAI